MIIMVVALTLPIFVHADSDPANIGYFGTQYSTKVADGEKKLILVGGYGTRIAGNLWELNSGQIGSSGYVSLEPALAYVFRLTGGSIVGVPVGAQLRGALHAGVSSDWVNSDGTGPWLNYIPGAIGGTLYVELPSYWGGAISARQKFTFKDSTKYQDGWIINLNITKRF